METIDTTPSKGRRIVKTVIAIALLLAIAGVGGYFMYSNVKWNPALIVHISTGVNESSGAHIITNVTFEQSKVIYKGTEAVATFPEISVMVRNNSLTAAPVTYWAATSWDSQETSGEYTITLVFKESYKPNSNDTLILTIYQTALGGKVMNKQTAFYGWME